MGEWFESLPSTSLGRGNFSLMMDVSGKFFTGTWTYGAADAAVAGTWNEPRLSYTRPSDVQCFASNGYITGVFQAVTCWCLIACMMSFTDLGVRAHCV